MASNKQYETLFMDFEVYPEWWCLGLERLEDENTYWITSDDSNYLFNLRALMNKTLLVGFNIKHYDMLILMDILKEKTAKQVYELSCKIVSNDEDEQLPEHLKYEFYNKFSFQDLFDDWKFGGLKKFEANTGMMVKECPVPFTKTDLTPEDKDLIKGYNKHDLRASKALYQYRLGYINTKELIAKEFNIPISLAFKKSHPSLFAEVLECEKRTFDKSEKCYIPPKIREYCEGIIGKELVDRVMNLPLNFGVKPTGFEIQMFDNTISMGDGGLHSIIGENVHVKATDKKAIFGIDVASYYPALMIEQKLLTRTASRPERLKMMRDKRIEIKRLPKDQITPYLNDLNLSYKLLINSGFGSMGCWYIKSYDTMMRSAICRVGQLLLVSLAKKIWYDCCAQIVQTNTDGILIYIDRTKIDKMKAIVKEWEQITQFEMEFEESEEVWQKNVNNYLEVYNREKGAVKVKGIWLGQAFAEGKSKRELKPLQAPICQYAAIQKLVYGKDVAETIKSCRNLLEYCFTTVQGGSFDYTIHETNSGIHKVQRINRVIATTNKNYGCLYKYNENFKGKPRKIKVGSIPLNSYIVNQDISEYDFDEISKHLDYEWYVTHAEKLLAEWREIE